MPTCDTSRTKNKQDAQLSQKDRAAECVSFGQKWKNGCSGV